MIIGVEKQMQKTGDFKKTNYEFKFLYAVGIIFIVAGHCSNDGGVSLFYDLFSPCSFHLGLFAFCSGYFYNKSNESNITAYILKKVRKLIIPLYAYNLFYGLFSTIMYNKGFTIGEKLTLYTAIVSPWTDGLHFYWNMGAWFVGTLFLTHLYNIIIRKAIRVNGIVYETLFVLFNICVGVLGAYLHRLGYNQTVFFVLERVMFFIPFYSVGYYYKTFLEGRIRCPNSIYFFLVVALQLILKYCYRQGTPYYNVARADYSSDGLVAPFLFGFLAIAFWIRIAKIVAPITKNSKIINLLADNTFSIMENQFIGFFILNTIYYALFVSFPNSQFFSMKFNIDLYKTSIWYEYLPFDMSAFSILYLFFGLLFSIAVSLLYKKIRLFIKTKYENKSIGMIS